ncbi:MAG: membrane protein of unknown function [Promethearchaeota archaeon]|nr:MAG: membrane protein of unknown function [Candidatus Lokiarchaeota archaeon]
MTSIDETKTKIKTKTKIDILSWEWHLFKIVLLLGIYELLGGTINLVLSKLDSLPPLWTHTLKVNTFFNSIFLNFLFGIGVLLIAFWVRYELKKDGPAEASVLSNGIFAGAYLSLLFGLLFHILMWLYPFYEPIGFLRWNFLFLALGISLLHTADLLVFLRSPRTFVSYALYHKYMCSTIAFVSFITLIITSLELYTPEFNQDPLLYWDRILWGLILAALSFGFLLKARQLRLRIGHFEEGNKQEEGQIIIVSLNGIPNDFGDDPKDSERIYTLWDDI